MARKLLLFLFITAFVIGGISLGRIYGKNLEKNPPVATPALQEQQSEETALSPGYPQKLEIPKLGVEASVENVREDSQGRMDVPKDYRNVAWYEPGYKPGEQGGAVFAGHLDTVTGNPAVFYNLGRLQPGDEIKVLDANGTLRGFRVTRIEIYDFDKVPLAEIFGSGRSQVNLITCDGAFDQTTRNYRKRLVVYSEKV